MGHARQFQKPGERFYSALKESSPLQIIGVQNAFVARLAEQAEFKALYLSGSALASHLYGFPDLGIHSLDNLVDEARRITDTTNLPLLVDIDTGFGSLLTIERTVKQLEKAGVAALHIEDQPFTKRCGHLDGKKIVSTEEMIERIKAAVSARNDPSFIIMARTDAYGIEDRGALHKRLQAYVEAGADMLFIEAVTNPEDYRTFKKWGVPLLANLTEFGKTALLTLDELKNLQVDMALYPLTITRIMDEAAWHAMKALKQTGTQQHLLPLMMTREETYRILNYKNYQERMDAWPHP